MVHRSIKIDFSNFDKVDNKGHIKAKVRIAYAGKNRNQSSISKETFESAIESLKNIPVVGNWLGNNFGGHDVIFEERGNEIIIKDSTTPFGVVPEDCNPRWEIVEDENGDNVEYFTCDVILWHERFPEQIDFVINNGANQSMEIMVTDGDIDDEGYFAINDFYYSALCLLGTSDDEDDNVEPAFEDSKVTAFKLDDKFKMKLDKAIKEEFKEAEKGMEFKELYEEMKTKFEELQRQFEESEDAKESSEEELKKQIEELEAKIKELEEELEGYEAEKLESQKQEVVDEYSDLLTEEVLTEATAEIETMSVEDLEFKLAKAVAESIKLEKKLAEEKAKEEFELKSEKVNPEKFGFSNKYNM